MSRIAKFCRNCRAEAGLRLYDAAYKLGMSPSELCSVENGESVATIPQIEAMAQFFGSNLDFLMHWYEQDERDRRKRVEPPVAGSISSPQQADLTNVVFLTRYKDRRWLTNSTSEEP
ncbi:helix-turn-helix domain-containing protein [Mesorhizobium amorphae]|uniref:helix-turn-helix domain-containing protein n=1 Tax=Mesorhizobium amorphae TaxID=71433 RepID=UPI003D0D2CE4